MVDKFAGPVRRFFLNSHEMHALDDLVVDGYLLAYVMYIGSFRRRMNFNTAVVGATKDSMVSLGYLQQCLERRAKRGSHWKSQCPTIDEIRGEISALEKVGLLRRLPKKKRNDPMLFFLPLADMGAFRTQEEPQMNPKRRTPNKSADSAGVSVGVRPIAQSADEPHITEIQSLQQQAAGIPMLAIIDLYHQVLPSAKQVRAIYDQDLTAKIIAVWQLDKRHQDMRFWRFLFEQVKVSDFSARARFRSAARQV